MPKPPEDDYAHVFTSGIALMCRRCGALIGDDPPLRTASMVTPRISHDAFHAYMDTAGELIKAMAGASHEHHE